ncbi:MAG: PD-(D/E)XK nuclease family protein, partial [Ktedonobacterales bacterium]|nr:PD-(D/E)XK nuclease family protein [Ktedonobacterales bacterium]
MIEGELRGLVGYTPRTRYPIVLLRCGGESDEGAEVAVILPEHARALARDLAALPDGRLRGLRLRVYHLWPARGDDPALPGDQPARRVLRAGAAGAVLVEPDLLLNITDINNAEYCVRHYPLRRMTPSPPTEAALRGTIIHQAFKELLKSGHAEPTPHLERALSASAMDLALLQLTPAQMAERAAPHLEALARWYERSRATLWHGATGIRAETFRLAPEVGLKGRLDIVSESETGASFLELKTGEVHTALPKRQHRWQVHGYQTLLAVRGLGGRGRAGATLLYSGTPGEAEPYGIPFSLRELHRVLELRNRLALTHATGQVPPPPGLAKCARCSLRLECARASALLGWEPPTIEDVPEPVEPVDAAWFAHAYEQLRLEARAAEEQAAQLWRLSAADRRAAGLALGGLEPLGEPRRLASGEWEYTFRCAQTSELREGDAVLLSDGNPI